tara:strand:+ start:4009 stop:5478 length:1470 start_codon:yes stop_codon:yes gene_type:complete
VELATGLGKTEIFTQLLKTWENGRCLVIAPYVELISQAAKKIFLRTGEQPGIEQAKNWSIETPWGRSKYVVASKDSLTSRTPPRYERIRDVGLVVVDEAHLSITPKWKEMLDFYRNDGAKVLGVTATAKRHDQKAMLNIYDKCVYQYGIADAVKGGWLVPAKTHCVQLESLDLKDVSTTNTVMGKDFNQKELNSLLEDSETIMEIADVTARETRGEKTVVYCSSVQEAKLVAERLVDSYGIPADWIASDTSKCTPQRRREVMRSFQEDPDGLTHVCNVGILTTGWDFPDLRNIVMARPTKSRALYTQIFGRGTRPLRGVVDFDNSTAESRQASIAFSDKPYFRMIDLVDSSLAHKIVTSPDVMSGTIGIEEIEKAKELILESQEAVELDEAVEEAKRAVREAREEAERQRRILIEAEARYKKLNIDPFRGAAQGGVHKKKRGARMIFGKFKGKLVEDLPTWYLDTCLKGKPYIAASWLLNAIRKERKRR